MRSAMISDVQIQRAVMTIRRMRGVEGDDGFPDDLGSFTQLYLGVAIGIAKPMIKPSALAACCKVHAPDALFFAELCEIASAEDWMREEILASVLAIMTGSSVEMAARLERRVRGGKRMVRRAGRPA